MRCGCLSQNTVPPLVSGGCVADGEIVHTCERILVGCGAVRLGSATGVEAQDLPSCTRGKEAARLGCPIVYGHVSSKPVVVKPQLRSGLPLRGAVHALTVVFFEGDAGHGRGLIEQVEIAYCRSKPRTSLVCRRWHRSRADRARFEGDCNSRTYSQVQHTGATCRGRHTGRSRYLDPEAGGNRSRRSP